MKEESKLIKGVDSLKWENGNNTYISALAAALRARGEKITYTELMGLSGAAFRLQYYLPHGCPSSPDATCGFDCSKPALDAMGYTGRHDGVGKDQAEDTKRIRKAIVDSIDRGYPVLAIDLIGSADWGVVSGYARNGEELLCRTYHNTSGFDEKSAKFPWAITILDGKRNAPDLKESFRKSLETAVMLARTEKFEVYASGNAAYEAWQKHLRDASSFADLSQDDLRSAMHTNAWTYVSLLDARSTAVSYLRQYQNLLGTSVSAHLAKAAAVYKEEADWLNQGRQYAHFPWEMKEGESWRPVDRAKEAEILERASALDKAAILEIERALQNSK